MGDVFENRQAEELVHGRIHRLQTESESPQSDLGDVGEPVQRFTIATTAIATPQEFGWRGYEIELAVDSTPGVAIGVAFSRADADTGRVQRLHPGERFTSVRPFRRVWLVSVGGAGSAVVHLTRTSLASRAPAQGYTQEALVSVYGMVPNPVSGAIIVETPALEDGLVDILWHPHATSSFGGDYYLQHRRAGAAVMTFYNWRHYAVWIGPGRVLRYRVAAGDTVRMATNSTWTTTNVEGFIQVFRAGQLT